MRALVCVLIALSACQSKADWLETFLSSDLALPPGVSPTVFDDNAVVALPVLADATLEPLRAEVDHGPIIALVVRLNGTTWTQLARALGKSSWADLQYGCWQSVVQRLRVCTAGSEASPALVFEPYAPLGEYLSQLMTRAPGRVGPVSDCLPESPMSLGLQDYARYRRDRSADARVTSHLCKIDAAHFDATVATALAPYAWLAFDERESGEVVHRAIYATPDGDRRMSYRRRSNTSPSLDFSEAYPLEELVPLLQLPPEELLAASTGLGFSCLEDHCERNIGGASASFSLSHGRFTVLVSGPPLAVVERLAHYLGVPLDDLQDDNRRSLGFAVGDCYINADIIGPPELGLGALTLVAEPQAPLSSVSLLWTCRDDDTLRQLFTSPWRGRDWSDLIDLTPSDLGIPDALPMGLSIERSDPAQAPYRHLTLEAAPVVTKTDRLTLFFLEVRADRISAVRLSSQGLPSLALAHFATERWGPPTPVAQDPVWIPEQRYVVDAERGLYALIDASLIKFRRLPAASSPAP